MRVRVDGKVYRPSLQTWRQNSMQRAPYVAKFSSMSNYLSTCIRKEHKTLCKSKGRSVADIMRLQVGGFKKK